jgi:hypothetical protein
MSPDRFTKGAYGYFEFTLRKKFRVDPRKGGTKLHNTVIETGFRLHGTVKENDDGHILIKDNDDIIYIPRKKDVRVFELGGRDSEKINS